MAVNCNTIDDNDFDQHGISTCCICSCTLGYLDQIILLPHPERFTFSCSDCRFYHTSCFSCYLDLLVKYLPQYSVLYCVPSDSSSATTPSPSTQVESPTSYNSGDDSYIASGKRPRIRTTITKQQLESLIAFYNYECKPSKEGYNHIVSTTGLPLRVVQVWFQNRRAKSKRA